MEGANVVQMGQREGHVDGFALIDGEQGQVVDGNNDAHVAALVAFGS